MSTKKTPSVNFLAARAPGGVSMKTIHRGWYFFVLFAFLVVYPGFGAAYDGLVEKKVFTLPSFTTVGGDVQQGQCHPHSSVLRRNRPCRRQVRRTDQEPGYWDSIIGSGRPLDTDKYFVTAGEGLINRGTKDGHTVTTGPASINPSTGKVYALRFPILTIRDLATAQKALIDSPDQESRNYMLSWVYRWVAFRASKTVFPDSTDRVIPVVGLAGTDGYLIENLDAWSAPIKLDPKWNQGDYYGKDEPLDGLITAYSLHQSQNYGGVSKTAGRKWAQEGKDPAKSWDTKFKAEEDLDNFAKSLATFSDANSFLYQAKAVQLFIAGDGQTLDSGLAKVKAKLLILPAQSDLMVYPKNSQDAAEHLKQLGKSVEHHEIVGE
jgi:homoserine O-acetyltransferase/O-succinyltransferase